MLRVALVGVIALAWLLVLASCMGATLPAPDAAPTLEPPSFVPLSLVVEPTPWSAAPLPMAEAQRVFRWPSDGRPSLVFVFDDAAT